MRHHASTDASCSLRELLQLRVAAGTFDRDPDQFAANLVERCKVETGTMELPDGRTISIRNTPVEGGGWVSAHEDMTERLRADRELHRTKAFLDTVIENVPATLIVKDARDQSYKLINRAGEEFFGFSRDEMIGKTIHEVLSKEHADPIAARDKEVLTNRASSYFMENIPVQTRHHGTRLVTSRRLAIPGEDGQPRYVLGVLEDITERRQAEEQIVHMARHDALTDLPNRAALNDAPGGDARRGGAARARASPCSASTSTASRRSRTSSATSSATSCCARFRAA